nr:unnamed protein product [Digitaria exilis]
MRHSKLNLRNSSCPEELEPVALVRLAVRSNLQLQAGYSGSDQRALKAADKIEALPGQPEGIEFDQYGGYVTVDEKNGSALFYYFVEAPQDASSKPLLLWLNGVANVIFLESPAGVGFSYSNTSSDYDESGDSKTAEDAFIFLVNWLERFPEYKNRAFYISGESYAGHYVPQLAATILSHNMFHNRTIINLQGILVGNPYLDDYKNQKGRYEYLWNHGVISDEQLANITHHCSFNSSEDVVCSDFYKWFDYGPIDPYNIYAPVCIDEPDGSYHSSSYLPGYNACEYYPTVTYLNDPMVQEAFHAIKTEWGGCT